MARGAVSFGMAQHIVQYHTQLATVSFDKIFDLTAGWSVFEFLQYIPGIGRLRVGVA